MLFLYRRLRNRREGAAWLDSSSLAKFDANFINISEAQRLIICASIAYLNNEDAELQTGTSFFSLMRNMTMTGYYTTELGFKDLGYVRHASNIWGGFASEALQKHGRAWLVDCVDHSKRKIDAEWDNDMNLIS